MPSSILYSWAEKGGSLGLWTLNPGSIRKGLAGIGRLHWWLSRQGTTLAGLWWPLGQNDSSISRWRDFLPVVELGLGRLRLVSQVVLGSQSSGSVMWPMVERLLGSSRSSVGLVDGEISAWWLVAWMGSSVGVTWKSDSACVGSRGAVANSGDDCAGGHRVLWWLCFFLCWFLSSLIAYSLEFLFFYLYFSLLWIRTSVGPVWLLRTAAWHSIFIVLSPFFFVCSLVSLFYFFILKFLLFLLPVGLCALVSLWLLSFRSFLCTKIGWNWEVWVQRAGGDCWVWRKFIGDGLERRGRERFDFIIIFISSFCFFFFFFLFLCLN